MRLAIMVLFAASCSLAQSPKLPEIVNPQNTPKKQADSKKNDGAINPLPVQNLIQADPEEQRTKDANNDTENNRRIADYTAKLAKYTEALVAVGIIQALIFIGHFVIFSKTLKAAREATAEQSRLTRRSNAITRRAVREAQRSNAANERLTLESNATSRASAEFAEKTLILTERAEVLVERVEMDGGQYDHATVRVILKNFGRTRANNVDLRAFHGIMETGNSDPIETRTPLVLGAGAEATVTGDGNVVAAIGMAMWNKVWVSEEFQFRAWGTITYEDVFGKNHTAKFRAGFIRHPQSFSIEENHSD